ncbi:MAG: hypothetical protein H7Y30_01600 [Pyrinomonadaceae bacterium]|nr:hypothetical protein [Pyrinomonadaceae bacterium]
MLRAAALSLLMLFSVVTMLPLTSSSAHNNEGSSASSSSRKKRLRRHSRAWWRRYRARLRRKRAALARQRALQALQAQNPETAAAAKLDDSAMSKSGGVYNHPRGLWSMTMPNGWTGRTASDGSEMKFRISADGRTTGQATLSVVAMANGSDAAGVTKRKQSQTLSGVPVTALRRTVIDRMVKENGWVVNDFQKEINGHRVFVVQAQTPASADGRTPPQAQTYYFTEVDGRIYSLATSAPVEASERVAAQSEQVVTSLRTSNRSSSSAPTEAAKR